MTTTISPPIDEPATNEFLADDWETTELHVPSPDQSTPNVQPPTPAPPHLPPQLSSPGRVGCLSFPTHRTPAAPHAGQHPRSLVAALMQRVGSSTGNVAKWGPAKPSCAIFQTLRGMRVPALGGVLPEYVALAMLPGAFTPPMGGMASHGPVAPCYLMLSIYQKYRPRFIS